MAFDLKKQCKTTGYYNNCGVNCLTHFLISKMQTGELQQRYANHPAYMELLETFKEYYGLEITPTWDQLNRLFAQNYPDPVQQEVVFGPVLRQNFAKILMEPSIIQAQWEGVVAAAISEYIANGKIEDAAIPVAKSNKAWFKQLRQDYIAHLKDILDLKKNPINKDEKAFATARLKEGKKQVTDASIQELVLFTRKNIALDSIVALAKHHWDTIACVNYAAHMSDLENAELISADQLRLMAQNFDIHLEVYTAASLEHPFLKDPRPMAKDAWVFKVSNLSHAHWEYEEPTGNAALVASHNKHYGKGQTPSIAHKDIQDNIIAQQFADVTLPSLGSIVFSRPKTGPQSGRVMTSPVVLPLPPVLTQPAQLPPPPPAAELPPPPPAAELPPPPPAAELPPPPPPVVMTGPVVLPPPPASVVVKPEAPVVNNDAPPPPPFPVAKPPVAPKPPKQTPPVEAPKPSLPLPPVNPGPQQIGRGNIVKPVVPARTPAPVAAPAAPAPIASLPAIQPQQVPEQQVVLIRQAPVQSRQPLAPVAPVVVSNRQAEAPQSNAVADEIADIRGRLKPTKQVKYQPPRLR